MAGNFVNNPVINSPFREPAKHYVLDEEGVPTGDTLEFRRPSSYTKSC